MKNKYKKGDWVRVVDNAGAPRFYSVGEICEVSSTSLSGLISCVGKAADMYEYRFEPWQPKVGERVRFVGEVGQFYTNGKDYDVLEVSGGKFAFTDDGVGPHFWDATTIIGKFIPTPVTDTLPVSEQPAAMTIQAGKFYKTRDGRKVGPMKKWRDDSEYDFESNNFLWKSDGENYDKGSVHTIIAEWVDAPVRDITAATVDAINDEYGPVVPVLVAPKFKVGDRVVSKGTPQAGVGVVESITTHGEYKVDFKDTWYRVCTETDNTIKHAPAPTTAIVALIEDGQPLPATRPAVHTSAEDAAKEARRLASVHKGQEFGVFVLTGATHKEAKVYEHEWQRLAAEGRRQDAQKALRRMSGLSEFSAASAVAHFIAA